MGEGLFIYFMESPYSLLQRYPSLFNALNANFPEFTWKVEHRDRLPKGTCLFPR